MTWNNRVWKSTIQCGDIAEDVYSIKETYYNTAGEVCARAEDPAGAHGYSLTELKENLERMLRAASMGEEDVLIEDGFVFAKWDFDDEEVDE